MRQTKYNTLLAQTKEALNDTKKGLELISEQQKFIERLQDINKELLTHLQLMELKIIPTISH